MSGTQETTITTPEGEVLDVQPSTQLVQVQGIVRPAVTGLAAREAFKEYQELCRDILDESDYRNGYKIKSAWRKLATCFNLSLKLVSENETKNEDGSIDFDVVIESTAPNGRSVIGDGSCNSREKNGNRSRHDTRATAHTRAFNRAVSNLIGAGEVSDEEIDDHHSSSTPSKKPVLAPRLSSKTSGPYLIQLPDVKMKDGSLKAHWLNGKTLEEAFKIENKATHQSLLKDTYDWYRNSKYKDATIQNFLEEAEAFYQKLNEDEADEELELPFKS